MSYVSKDKFIQDYVVAPVVLLFDCNCHIPTLLSLGHPVLFLVCCYGTLAKCAEHQLKCF